jgi:hypothetical protein
MTPAGAGKLREASKTHVAGIQRLFLEHFSAREIDQLAGLLGRLPGSNAETPCTIE